MALLDLSSDLIQLNKQILQRRLLELPLQNPDRAGLRQPQTCQNKNKERLIFSQSTPELGHEAEQERRAQPTEA